MTAGLLTTTEESPVLAAVPANELPWDLTLFSLSWKPAAWTLDAKAMAPAMPRARTVMWGILRIAGVSPVTGCAASQCSRAGCPSSPPEFALPDPRRGAHYTVLLRVVNVHSGTRRRTPRC